LIEVVILDWRLVIGGSSLADDPNHESTIDNQQPINHQRSENHQ
jgi:hypothetical protein